MESNTHLSRFAERETVRAAGRRVVVLTRSCCCAFERVWGLDGREGKRHSGSLAKTAFPRMGSKLRNHRKTTQQSARQQKCAATTFSLRTRISTRDDTWGPERASHWADRVQELHTPTLSLHHSLCNSHAHALIHFPKRKRKVPSSDGEVRQERGEEGAGGRPAEAGAERPFDVRAVTPRGVRWVTWTLLVVSSWCCLPFSPRCLATAVRRAFFWVTSSCCG